MENFFKKLEGNNNNEEKDFAGRKTDKKNESVEGESKKSNEEKILELEVKIRDIYNFMIESSNCDKDEESKKIKALESQIETLKLDQKPGLDKSLELETNRPLEDFTSEELEVTLAELRAKQMDFDSDFNIQDKEKIKKIEEILLEKKVA